MKTIGLEELQVKRAMLRTFQSAAFPEVALPPVSPPSIDDLAVDCPVPVPLTEEDLLERYTRLVRSKAPSRERGREERVEMGDEVELDVVGYAGGIPIPFSARIGWQVAVAPSEALPGLFEGLVGLNVGVPAVIEVTLPACYPVESLRGASASFSVEVKRALEIGAVDEAAPDWPAGLGLGSSLEEVMERIHSQLAEEREREARKELLDRVLDELAARVDVALPSSLVDLEIRRGWQGAEQPALAGRGLSPEVVEASYQGWRSDPATRVDADRRLRVALGLRALMEAAPFDASREDRDEVLAAVAGASGMEVAEVARAAVEGPELAGRLEQLARHFSALDWVLSRVAVAPPAPH